MFIDEESLTPLTFIEEKDICLYYAFVNNE